MNSPSLKYSPNYLICLPSDSCLSPDQNRIPLMPQMWRPGFEKWVHFIAPLLRKHPDVSFVRIIWGSSRVITVINKHVNSHSEPRVSPRKLSCANRTWILHIKMKGEKQHMTNKQSNKPQAKPHKQGEAVRHAYLGMGSNWLTIWTHFKNQPQPLRQPIEQRTENREKAT